MKKQVTIVSLVLILSIVASKAKAQAIASQNKSICSTNLNASNSFLITADSTDANTSISTQSFYITPFYQFTQFKELKLTLHTNRYKLYEGEYEYEYPQEDLDEYNDNYGTEYQNNMYGLRVGYQTIVGFSLSGFIGFDNYGFKSWISKNGNQYNSTNKPAVTYGAALDYRAPIYGKLIGMAMLTYNYVKSKEADQTNSNGNPISSINFTSSYWEMNLVLGYPLGSFLPYAGAGYTELYVSSVQEEVISNTENGEVFYDKIEFDSNFKGKSFYGFAGVQYNLSKNLSVYARSSFPNPLRGSLGLKIIL